MKLSLTIFLILGFVGLAVFGFLWMDPMQQNCCHKFCIADLVQGGACPEPNNPFRIFNYHISAFQSFSQALLLIITLLALSVLFFNLKSKILNPKSLGIATFVQQAEIFGFKRHFQNWLKLLEKRDPIR